MFFTNSIYLAVLLQGCCCKGAVDQREFGGDVARVLSIDCSAAVLSVLS